MAKTITFLAAVNETLKRAGVIAGSSGELTTFTGSNRQTDIDMMLSSWNDVIDELYSIGVERESTAEGTFTISTSGTDSGREYSVPADFVDIIGNPVNMENSYILKPYPGGFEAMRIARLDPDDFQGQPSWYVISPVNGNIRIDTTPTTDEDGDVYEFTYQKAINLSGTTDTFPFDDEVVRTLQDAVWQTWILRRQSSSDFLESIWLRSMSRAVRMLNGPAKKSYGAR